MKDGARLESDTEPPPPVPTLDWSHSSRECAALSARWASVSHLRVAGADAPVEVISDAHMAPRTASHVAPPMTSLDLPHSLSHGLPMTSRMASQ